MAFIFAITILIIAALLTVLVGIFEIYSLYAMIKAAPFVPTASNLVGTMVKLAELKSDDNLMDLGSGDGRIVKAAAPLVARAVGVEINPVLYWLSRWRLRQVKNVEIRREDLWQTDLSNIDVLAVYFINNKMEQLAGKIKREMKLGSRIVSHGFQFPNWNWVRKDDKVYLYIV